MNTASSQHCPQCGAPLAPNAPAGLCPKCLMALNLKTETAFTDDSARPAAPLPPEEIAPHFPQLEILECLGRGGMGVVYKARQKTLNRFVALKLLAPERVRDPKFAERFAREAQALAALNHPNIVTVYDFGQVGQASSLSATETKTGRIPVPLYYLVMEFVDGANLRQLLRARKFTPEEALAIVPPLCEALQFAHDRGIVHRDIKPENLLLDKTGRVKIADFGIAKMLGPGNGGGAPDSPAPESLTQSTVGTPGYSAPEQKSDPQRVDSRADIYSLGVVIYEMLTGELPGKPLEPPSRKVRLDVRIDEIVMRALEKEPELRFQTVTQLKTNVEALTQSTPPTASGVQSPSPLEVVYRNVRGPAIGLIVTAILNWLTIPLIFLVTLWATSWSDADNNWLILVPLAALVLSSAMLLAGLKMKRLEAYGLAITGSILAILVSPGNVIGLPLGIWALVVLSHREVREAFGKGHPLPRLEPASSNRSGIGWKVAAAIAAVVMLLVAIPISGLLLAIVVPNFVRARHAAAADFVVSGTVVDAVTGRPIAGARVDDNQYGASPTTAPRQAWTDSNGHYELKTWYEEHNLAASAPGYETKIEILLTKPVGREREARIDFLLEPTSPGAPTYGPEREVELIGDEDLQNCFLDFDTGRKLSAPRELVESLRARGQLSRGAPHVLVIRDWMRSSGADLIQRTQGAGLLQADGACMLMAEKAGPDADALAFATIPAERVVRAVEEFERVLAEGPRPADPVSFGFQKPAIHGVKTREGAMALVEILAADTQSDKTRLRYKLVRSANARPPAGLLSAFGPVREVTLNDCDVQAEALDLETGRIQVVPREAGEQVRADNLQWFVETGADLLTDTTSKGVGLITTRTNELRLVKLTDEEWPTLTPVRLRAALSNGVSGLAEDQARHFGKVYYLSTNIPAPVTLGFRTGGGAEGLLQLTRFGEGDQPPVTLRYKLVAPSQAERLSNNEAAGTASTLRVPDGTIELAGIAEHPSTSHAWWRPDGSPLLHRVWEVDPKAQQPGSSLPPEQLTHLWRQFVLHATGATDPARILDFEFDGSPGANFGFKVLSGSQQLDEWQGLVKSFPKEQTSTQLRVGVATGSFQPAPEADVLRFNDLSFAGRVGAVRFTVGKVFERERRAAFSLSVDLGTNITRATFEYRLRAQDRRGRWHTARIVEGQSSHGLVNEVCVFDGLRRDDVAEVRFETRPVHWVEFRDVPLHAGAMTLPQPGLRASDSREAASLLRTGVDPFLIALHDALRSGDLTNALRWHEKLARAVHDYTAKYGGTEVAFPAQAVNMIEETGVMLREGNLEHAKRFLNAAERAFTPEFLEKFRTDAPEKSSIRAGDIAPQ